MHAVRADSAPTGGHCVAAIVERDDHRALVAYRWGLVPAWTKDVRIDSRLFNARAETVAASPAFRQAFRRTRCLIPADGFYEWRRTPDEDARKRKVP